jgi:hypothetical protein
MKLPKGRAPTYRLKKEFSELPQGSFINPIARRYLPNHIFDRISSFYNDDIETVCFTSKGFIIIPWEFIEIE